MASYQLYLISRNQFIVTGFGDIVGYNYSTVLDLVKLYVPDEDERKIIFEKVIYLLQLELHKIWEDKKKKTDK